jgi:hypothetical protein
MPQYKVIKDDRCENFALIDADTDELISCHETVKEAVEIIRNQD